MLLATPEGEALLEELAEPTGPAQTARARRRALAEAHGGEVVQVA